ncbi:MAG: 2-oxo acid dehydrogenase subunit E2 [Flavobacteriales bacterium]|nr:2-oxo acid dehydrogenase subunit E2 [Flavobacteriales bacterium]MCB9447640.1 2-oxo acid dehydrogenase subunit E2 [Flavobacteriales bacterium]
MANVEVLMPKMGESVAEATITKWLKEEGEMVELDEPLLEIATDKVDSEIPSPYEGVLSKKLFKEGDVVQVGKPIAVIGSESAASQPSPAAAQAPADEVPAQPAPAAQTMETPAVAETSHVSHAATPARSGDRFYSPLVRNIARLEGIGIDELDALEGTGVNGRVTKKDLLAYLPVRKRGRVQPTANGSASHVETAPAAPPAPAAKPAAPAQAPAVSVSGDDEVIEMDRMRKLIADHMVMSKHTSPHVTSCVEADVTNIVLWREKMKKHFEKKEGEKLTFTPIFIEALVKAIKDFPLINISVDGQRIIVKKNINIGMAAALPSGNLIVPVIKNADRMNLLGLTKAVNDLANRARINKLQPDEIQGGTYTLTNVGTFGNVLGTPIINQPQVAIMATGIIKKKPVVIETPSGDTIGIRHMMFLSHSYDHRVVDGALGGSFVRRVADYLEQFDMNREI